MNPVFLDTREKQLEAKRDFQGLFLEAFGRSMPDDRWEHFYLHSPFGQTVSIACFEGGLMVAHGGLIPLQLVSKEGGKVDYFLQTAIMIRKSFRALPLFMALMSSIHAFVRSRGSFVMAFPNRNTYLPFVKLLQWKLVVEYSIQQYRLGEDTTPGGLCDEECDFEYEICKDEAFMNWRRELNRSEILRVEGCEVVHKDFEGCLEILDVSPGKGRLPLRVASWAHQLGYRKVNIPGCFNGALSLAGLVLEGTVGIPQRMCVYPSSHAACRYEEIRPSLLLSDVF